MRETLKSLSIFSAMLLFLLLISSGCDVNIPGCGKRSLPFFKPVTPPVSAPVSTASPSLPATASAPVSTAPSFPAQQPVKNNISNNPSNTSIEMSVTKPTTTQIPTVTATPQEEIEKIAYTTMEHGKPTLWTMNTDGTTRARLTQVGTDSWYPLWSPSGKILAFLSDMNGGKINLYVIKKGGTDFQQLTSFEDMSITDFSNLKPPFSWSPKSDEIAFCYHHQIWKVNLDTLSQETLSSQDPNYVISALEWAPHRDNKYIAFLVKQGIKYSALKLVNPRLKDELKLAEQDNSIYDLTWTADARNVAYLVDQKSVFTASSQTSLPKMIISNASPELGPLLAYSPSETGSSLMVLAKQYPEDKGYRVALVDKASTDGVVDSGSLKYLTEPGVENAVWSPDGTKIAYLQSNGELWVMDAITGAKKARIALIGIQSPSWSKK